MNKTKKINNKTTNKTKKNKINKHELICKQTTSSYTSFEEKIDEIFKKNKINILSASILRKTAK